MENGKQEVYAMKRILAISDIHGELELFNRLLEQVNYDASTDQLILLLAITWTAARMQKGCWNGSSNWSSKAQSCCAAITTK